jgi:hypothetical protein
MTESTPQAANGHRRAGTLPFTPFTPAETPILDAEGGITAGSETVAEPVSPVEGHDVVVKPASGRRWEALREQDVQLPAALRDPAAFRTAVRRELRAVRNAAVLAVVALPKTVGLCAWWTVRGTALSTSDLILWLLVRELHPDLSSTPAGSDRAAIAMDHRRLMRQRIRRNILVTTLAVTAGVTGAAWYYLGTLPLWLLGSGLVAFLAWRGKPVGRKVFLPTGTQKLLPRLTLGSIVSAFGVLGISEVNSSIKAGTTDRWWTSTPQAIRGGHVVDMVLPGGVEARTLIPYEQRLAGALGRPEDCVIVEPRPRMTPSNLRLYVYDSPRLERVGAGPLATTKRISWFDAVQLGITRSGTIHREQLHGGAWFIGGRPASGKSSAGFIAAAHTVLDPTARLMISALKGPVDWPVFEPVCTRYVVGSPEMSPDVIPQSVALLRWLLDEAGRRNDFLGKLRRKGVPGTNQVTRDLSTKYPQELGPITAIFDEAHRLFDASDNPDVRETVELAAKTIKAVRSAGINLIFLTQLAGSDAIPLVLTKASRLRGCMRVSDEVSFRQVAGNAGKGAFAASGAGRLQPGQIILMSDTGDPVKVGVYHLEPLLGRIVTRAQTVRETLGVLGRDETPLPGIVDPTILLRDVAAAIPGTAPVGGPADGDVAWLSELEAVLGEKEPYRGRCAGWLAVELRSPARRVATAQVNRRCPVSEQYPSGQRNGPGVRLGDVRAALVRLLDE